MHMNQNQYEQELFAQRTPYLQWLKQQETTLARQYGRQLEQGALGKQIHTLPFSSCMDHMNDVGHARDHSFAEFQGDRIYLFARDAGRLSPYAKAVFAKAFLDDADVVLAYADEDYSGSLRELYGIGEADRQSGARYRGAPWFKPGFSPDTLVSFFYVGSVFAVRGDRILEVTGKYGSDISLHELVYRIFMEALGRRRQGVTCGIAHLPYTLYTNDSLADKDRTEGDGKIRLLYRAEERRKGADNDKISIVIPSKDNADVLRKCLETLVQYTDYSCYEVIVVDNGSSPEQRARISRVIETLKTKKSGLAVHYLYRERAFNFSAMCNAGARQASGAYLLFLNDDIEILGGADGGQWLDRMLAYGRKSHVGAVGAKLYYPPGQGERGCHKIQHAGITNMGIGPAHKLGGMADEGCLYHGHNTQNYDMLAVTAACMLIRRSVFDSAGGFDEDFSVAYNDVELCFRLYQMGYFNVQVNEAVLIHHESLSRGQDTLPERQRRLAGEKQKLYQKYPLLNAADPFYSPHLVQWRRDVEYNTGYLYAFDRQAEPVMRGCDRAAKKRERSLFKRAHIRDMLCEKCAPAAKLYDRLTGYCDMMFHIDNIRYGDGITDGKTTDNNTDDMVVIEGWSAVRNADNADLPRRLWLIGAESCCAYEFDIAPKLREDVAAVLEEGAGNRTKNTALSGIQVNIAISTLKPGTYGIGVVCNNKLVCDQEKYVAIPDKNTEGKV